MFLSDLHRQKLRECGIREETARRAWLHSGSPEEVRAVLGYGTGGTGLVIPYGRDGYSRVRIDNPGPDGKRYRTAKGAGNRLYVPPIIAPEVLTNAGLPIWVTEGELKSLKATQEDFPCVAVPGVWSWKGRLHGRSFPIPELDRVVWMRRRAIIVFDGDLADKPPVQWAEHALIQELRRRGAEVYILRLPPDGPKGIDDFLAAKGVEAFRALRMQTPAEADQEASPFLRMAEIADAYITRATRVDARLPIGYPELAEVIRGLAAGEVMTILGRAGVGKTAFGLNLIDRMTTPTQSPALMFSLEQPAVEIFERVVSVAEGIEGVDLEKRVRDEDESVLELLVRTVRRWDHVVVVERPCRIDECDLLVRRAKEGTFWPSPLRLVVVDYLGLVNAVRPGSSYDVTSQVAKEVKQIAKRHQVALVLLAQISREGGQGGEPVTMTMARESGVIEEAADYMLGIWRPELEEGISREERRKVQGQFKVRVLKNRHGPSNKTATLVFERATLLIRDATEPGRL